MSHNSTAGYVSGGYLFAVQPDSEATEPETTAPADKDTEEDAKESTKSSKPADTDKKDSKAE